MRKFTAILFVIILTAFLACSDSQFSEKNIEDKAINITEKLDSTSIKIFYEWGFGQRGEADIFTKRSDNPESGYYRYSCFYLNNIDSVKLLIYRFQSFKEDFPCNIQIDSSKYHRVSINKLNNNSVCISAVDNRGRDVIIVESILLNKLFPINDPFKKFKYLSDLKDSLGILGNSYRPDIGNFIEFYLSSQHILTYLPDNLYLNPKYKEVWLEIFAEGKTIKKNWNLRELDKPMDNG